ncbi:PqqD family protein [Streptomyces sp. 12297]|uniref:PqqD family protein n=1 Tax=Streptomyces sp. NBC_00239 TaxID=2903640 RepID=UPI002E2BCFB2|nr:PqqD family protein [Streptomyces sp. NBC_00239]
MRYRIDPEVVWTPSQDEVRLYSARTGEFQTLNSTAAQIWLGISENGSAEDTAAELAVRYGADSPAQRALITRDIEEFVTRLVAQGLLEEESGAARA